MEELILTILICLQSRKVELAAAKNISSFYLSNPKKVE